MPLQGSGRIIVGQPCIEWLLRLTHAFPDVRLRKSMHVMNIQVEILCRQPPCVACTVPLCVVAAHAFTTLMLMLADTLQVTSRHVDGCCAASFMQ